MKPPELLAPAGDFECLRAACDHGADAVYIGLGQFNLRARSGNFAIRELVDAIDFVHAANRKIYGTLNIMPGDDMLEQIEAYVKSIALLDRVPDAIIVSDPGVMALCKTYLSEVTLHLSTQTGTSNYLSARFWQDQGVRRIVLPREMTLDHVSSITRKLSIETELFIHGAMCVSISGRCLLGAYLGKRHANWGDCPQPCRLKYRIAPEKIGEDNDVDWMSVEEYPGFEGNSSVAYLLNSKDLSTVSILPRILDTGVASLKIEGRNKSAHYVASVVKVYREALDFCLENPAAYFVKPQWTEELNRLDHRTYTTGFLGGEYELQDTVKSQNLSGLRIVGSVKGIMTTGEAVIDVKNPFTQQDAFNVLPVKKGVDAYDMRLTALTDLNGNPLNRAITHRVVLVKTVDQLSIGDMLRKKG
jgi:putative protease